MIALVVYDSSYGNTASVAQAIAAGLGTSARPIADVDPARLPRLDMLVAGAPTQGGRPKAEMSQWLARLPAGGLAGVRVAGFDTRVEAAERGFALRALMAVIGYAAPRISKALAEHGGITIAAPEGFFVEGREGPLRSGELERAQRWASRLVE